MRRLGVAMPERRCLRDRAPWALEARRMVPGRSARPRSPRPSSRCRIHDACRRSRSESGSTGEFSDTPTGPLAVKIVAFAGRAASGKSAIAARRRRAARSVASSRRGSCPLPTEGRRSPDTYRRASPSATSAPRQNGGTDRRAAVRSSGAGRRVGREVRRARRRDVERATERAARRRDRRPHPGPGTRHRRGEGADAIWLA